VHHRGGQRSLRMVEFLFGIQVYIDIGCTHNNEKYVSAILFIFLVCKDPKLSLGTYKFIENITNFMLYIHYIFSQQTAMAIWECPGKKFFEVVTLCSLG
jgi:hypothetical protein